MKRTIAWSVIVWSSVVAVAVASDSFILRPLGDTRTRTLPTTPSSVQPFFNTAPQTAYPTPTQPYTPPAVTQPTYQQPPIYPTPVVTQPQIAQPIVQQPRVVAPTYNIPASTYATPPGLPAGSYLIPNTAVPGDCYGPSPYRPTAYSGAATSRYPSSSYHGASTYGGGSTYQAAMPVVPSTYNTVPASYAAPQTAPAPAAAASWWPFGW
jgi:hypothetical protein